jgi:hypothetical protein
MAAETEGDRGGRARDRSELRLTRRVAIATGIVFGRDIICGFDALGRTVGPTQLLALLRRQIHRARIDGHLKVRLLTLIARAQRELQHEKRTHADQDLERFIGVLLQNAGKHRLSRSRAHDWINTAQRIRATIGRAPALAVAHSGISTWVIVDTAGLRVPRGTRLLIDGRDATRAFGYPQPTPDHPKVELLLSVATHTFSWGPYQAILSVYWRGYPYAARNDYYAALNNAYFHGMQPNLGAAPKGVDEGAPFQAWAALNNGYSVVPDPAPASSCVFAVAPGDQPYVPGVSTTEDTRAELGLTDDYSRGIPHSPPGGIDAMGNISRTVRFWRLDYSFPSTWIAPVPVQNTQGAWAVPPFGTGRGRWQLPPAARGGPRPTAVISNSVVAIELISNVTETGGPGVVVWGVTNGGQNVCWRYQPVALGQDLKTLLIDSHPYTFDGRESTILEYRPALHCMGASGRRIYTYGVPLGGPPYGGGYLRTWRLIGGVWTCTSAGSPYAVPGSPTIVAGAIVGDGVHGTEAGKIFGPTLKSDAQGALIEGLEATPGINVGASVPAPVCVREWPLLIGPTFASVSAPPAA